MVPASAVPEVVDVFEKFGLTCSIFLHIVCVLINNSQSCMRCLIVSCTCILHTVSEIFVYTSCVFLTFLVEKIKVYDVQTQCCADLISCVCAHFHFCCQLCCAERHQNYPLLLLLLIYYHHFGSSIATLWNNLKCFRHLAVD